MYNLFTKSTDECYENLLSFPVDDFFLSGTIHPFNNWGLDYILSTSFMMGYCISHLAQEGKMRKNPDNILIHEGLYMRMALKSRIMPYLRNYTVTMPTACLVKHQSTFLFLNEGFHNCYGEG